MPYIALSLKTRGNPYPIAFKILELSETSRKYTEALMLAITAPTDEQSKECEIIAAQIGAHLSEKERDLAHKGIEVAIDFLKNSRASK